jgi:hypothetical protein
VRPIRALRRRLSKFKPPSPPFISARHHGGSQVPKAIVIHGTVSSDNRGTARSIAKWWHGITSPITSAHYVVDPAETIQCVGDHTIAYHCGFNTGSIAIELCDEEVGPATRWQDADSQAIIRRAAKLAAELCLAYGIDPFRPTVSALKRKGPHGIYGHNDSRLAFGFTTHTDPIDFPWAQFLGLVRKNVREMKLAATDPKPSPKHKILDLGTFNVGSANKDQIISSLIGSDATVLQEMSDQDAVVKAIEEEGWGVIRPDLPGAHATPLVYNRATLQLIRPVVFRLLNAQHVGPGAGPSRSKDKYFVGGLFAVKGTRRKVLIGGQHNLASQGLPLRKRLALQFTTALNSGLVKRVWAVFIGGDWNAQQGGPSLNPLHAAGWHFTDQHDTHGKRGIDFWIWKDRKRAGSIVTYRKSVIHSGGGSDHEAYIARFWITC